MTYDLNNKRIFVAGHRGLVGSSVVRRLRHENCTVLTATRAELDLMNQAQVNAWFEKNKPDAVVLAAAKVGGILANNTYPAEFIYNNMMIEMNVIHSAYQAGVEKLLFLGSSCIYPKFAEQPIREESLLTGALEPTNQPYAIAKIAGIEMCQSYRRQYGANFISAQPTNLYGIGDNFDLKTSHVLPALMVKAHNAKMRGDKSMVLWGSGKPLREFLFVDDLADALVFLMKNYNDPMQINVGVGEDISIRDLAQMVAEVVGHKIDFEFDTSKPDGTPRKLLDVSRLHNLGWRAQTSLRDGIAKTYEWYLQNVANTQARKDKGREHAA